jgi:large subunit ribosomal protein L9
MMQVLLMQNVPGIGNAGEVKKVTDGYARNFLLPRKLAVVATEGAIKQSDAIKQAVVRREAKTRSEAEELAKLIEKVTLTFQAKAGEGDRLFGSITSGDIADALAREKGITVDKRKIELDSPLKELGSHPVPIKLHSDVTAKVMVVVERQAA